ncbi:MAG: hypothetical protein H6Q31_597, partial [Bacteroidetes bacterium]|nr:hypothetical protein [Bacteroidota bacterium]
TCTNATCTNAGRRNQDGRLFSNKGDLRALDARLARKKGAGTCRIPQKYTIGSYFLTLGGHLGILKFGFFTIVKSH